MVDFPLSFVSLAGGRGVTLQIEKKLRSNEPLSDFPQIHANDARLLSCKMGDQYIKYMASPNYQKIPPQEKRDS